MFLFTYYNYRIKLLIYILYQKTMILDVFMNNIFRKVLCLRNWNCIFKM